MPEYVHDARQSGCPYCGEEWEETLGEDGARCATHGVLSWREIEDVRTTRAETAGPDPIATNFACTDSGNAELLAHLYGKRLRYDHQRGCWLVYRDHWWVKDTDGQIHRLAKEAARRRYRAAESIVDIKQKEEGARWAISSESRMRREAALSLAQAERPIADPGDSWDVDPWLLGVANGVVDLRTGELRRGRQDDRISMHTPVPFKPGASCPRWDLFLQQVFDGDDEIIDWVYRALGYSTTDDTSEEAILVGWGSGWNGKTSLFRQVRDTLGDYAHNTAFTTLEQSARYSIPNDLAALKGRRFVTASEINEGARLNEARIKMLAGRDPVSARFLHGEWFTFMPALKLWLAVNHRPIVTDDSTGFWRKIRLIPFTVSFEGRADPDLDKALRAETPGILAWLVRGALAWQERGLEPPESVRTATQIYREESDVLGPFLAARCVVDPAYATAANLLYKEYSAFAESEGLREKERLSATSFGRRMSQRFQRRPTRNGRMYEGIRVLDGAAQGLVNEG